MSSGAKLLATLVAVRNVDRFGRRPLLFAGIAMMLLALLTLAAAFALSTTPPNAAASGGGGAVTLPPGWPPAVVLALIAYVSGYQVGFGPVSWLTISEVFPLRVRSYIYIT